MHDIEPKVGVISGVGQTDEAFVADALKAIGLKFGKIFNFYKRLNL